MGVVRESERVHSSSEDPVGNWMDIETVMLNAIGKTQKLSIICVSHMRKPTINKE